MEARTLQLSNAAGAITFWTASINPDGFSLINGLDGLGLPDVQVRMGSGAGDGTSIQGVRVLERADLALQVRVAAPDEAGLLEHLSTLWKVIGGQYTSARLTWGIGDDEWRLDVTRTGGGKYRLGDALSTDGVTYIRPSPLTFVAPDPYWTAVSADTRVLQPDAATRGLLTGVGSLSGLFLKSSEVLGDVEIDNTGDSQAFPTVLIAGPATSYTATSPDGEVLSWSGTLIEGEHITFDHKAKTAVDDEGDNRYAELGAAPRFWSLPPGESTATFGLEGTDENSRITVSWRPRRAAVI